MIIRVGLPMSTGTQPTWLQDMDQPALLSAGSLWDAEHGRFRRVGSTASELDCALDSSGFVRMASGAGYPWTVAQYVELAGLHGWAWWAQMDLPCEPEVAKDDDEVFERQGLSGAYLSACRSQARQWRKAGAWWLTDPVPVLQGWEPQQYLRCADLYDQVLGGRWPEPVGLIAVLRELDRRLPPAVQLHLFGVKGQALDLLRDNPRIASVDSQAWQAAARRTAFKESSAAGQRVPCDLAMKRQALGHWLGKQKDTGPQRGLFADLPE